MSEKSKRLTPGDARRYFNPVVGAPATTEYWKNVLPEAQPYCLALRTAQNLIMEGAIDRYEALVILDYLRERLYSPKMMSGMNPKWEQPKYVLFWRDAESGLILQCPGDSIWHTVHDIYHPKTCEIPTVTSMFSVPRQYPNPDEIWFLW